ncbi:MAG TPA: site-2 protease family protein [Polyangiaceae bacterium]
MELILPRLALYLMFVFSTTCHEAAHAYAAKRGGDNTAYALGHVTLDPMPHIRRSPFGMVILPLISVFTMGYPLGFASVPYDPEWGQRHPLRQALMSLSGPLANFALAITAIGILRALMAAGIFHLDGGGVQMGFVVLNDGVAANSPLAALAFVLSYLFTLNLILGIFNLVPLPPLDGSGVAEGLSPRMLGSFYARLRDIPAHELLGWIVASQLFRYADGPLNSLILLALGL